MDIFTLLISLIIIIIVLSSSSISSINVISCLCVFPLQRVFTPV